MKIYVLFLFFALAACETAGVSSYLEGRYCPQALVVKGSEVLREGGREVELAKLQVACDVSWSGEIGQRSFAVNGVGVELGVNVRSRQSDSSNEPVRIFAEIVRRRDGNKNRRSIAREVFELTPARNRWRKQTVRFDIPRKLAKQAANHLILVGFLPKK